MKYKLLLVIIYCSLSTIYGQGHASKASWTVETILAGFSEDYLGQGYGMRGKVKTNNESGTNMLFQISYLDWVEKETRNRITHTILSESVSDATATIIEVGVTQSIKHQKNIIDLFATVGLNIWDNKYINKTTYESYLFTNHVKTTESDYSGKNNHFTVSFGFGWGYKFSESLSVGSNLFYNYVTFDKSFYGIALGFSFYY